MYSNWLVLHLITTAQEPRVLSYDLSCSVLLDYKFALLKYNFNQTSYVRWKSVYSIPVHRSITCLQNGRVSGSDTAVTV